ncbi:MAG: Hsp33 family molecular chaperone HslO, partial [Gammaproteobacteria bacterium]|nr:Hsp33 family molecular chaperone HslO [Gammaproteobacteria bacterium]
SVGKEGEIISRSLRGMAEYDGDPNPGDLAELFGSGQIVVTITPDTSEERFQGIVALEGANIAEALRGYLQQSEQLDTLMWLSASGEHSAGFMLQRLPASDEEDIEAWNRICHLASTLTDEELLSLPPQQLLHRLFHEEDVRLFEAEEVSFHCSCSRERVGNMLKGLGREELEDIIQEQGSVEVSCEFCKQDYSFDAVDVEQLLVSNDMFESPRETQ